MTEVQLAPPRRPRRASCKVCALPTPEVDLVEGASLSGWSPRSVAARFGTLTRRDVQSHMHKCVVSEKKEDE